MAIDLSFAEEILAEACIYSTQLNIIPTLPEVTPAPLIPDHLYLNQSHGHGKGNNTHGANYPYDAHAIKQLSDHHYWNFIRGLGWDLYQERTDALTWQLEQTNQSEIGEAVIGQTRALAAPRIVRPRRP